MNQHTKFFPGLFSDRKRLRLAFFLFFAIFVVAISITYFILNIGEPYIGIVLTGKGDNWSVQSVDPNGQAILAGIQVGDVPTQINNEPAEILLEQYENTGTVFGLLIRQITVVNESGQIKTVSILNGTIPWQTVLELVSWFIVCLIFWIVGFYVFFKRPNNLAALLLFLCSLVFGLALSSTLSGQREVFAAPPIAVITTIIGPWLLLHFFLVLPEEHRRLSTKPGLYLIYLLPFITLILFPLIGYANGQPLLEFRTFRMIELAAGFAAIVLVVVLNYILAKSAKTRQQMRIVLVSCLAALVPFILFSVLPDVRKNWLNIIIDNGKKISNMVDDMLNITRIQSGKVRFNIESVSLSEELEKQIDILRETSQKHEFVLDIEPNLPHVLIDRDKFIHVLGNLLSNAIKYSPDGGWIKLSAANDFKANRLLVIVADQGIGISENDKASLFQTFHRIKRPETQGISGSGLGLYIAKEWIEAMKGEIWLESELNKGTKVFLGIPYAE